MSVSSTRIGYRMVVDVGGDIDLATAGELRADLSSILSSGEPEVWIDLNRVSFLDSNGLHVLVDVAGELRADGRRLAIICGPGRVLRTIGLAGLDGHLPIFPDRASAHRLS